MRDLAAMGESTFALWCAQAGLVQNGSRIDRTGWDFYVEFPHPSAMRADELHAAAIECKVQVKASDHSAGKLAIKLSNLRRLATAQLPAFFVFIEFDRVDTARRAYLVHVDNTMIEKTLKRTHEIEQVEGRTDHHKRTMTVTYGPEQEIKPLTGQAVRERIETFVQGGMAAYVARKKCFLESVGFENGYAHFTFKTEGEQNLKDLIDVSVGARKSVAIKSFTGFHTRFGIRSKSPMLESESGELEMPDLKPTAKGVVRLREDRLSPSLTFECRLFVSPLNVAVPRSLATMRVEGENFDIRLSPSDSSALQFTVDPAAGGPIAIPRLRDVLRLLYLLSSSSKRLTMEFSFDGLPSFEMTIAALDRPFALSRELQALDCAVNILSQFDVGATATATLSEVSRNSEAICQLHQVLNEHRQSAFKVEFGVEGHGFDSSKPVACIALPSARIGSHVFGLILVVTGNVRALPDGRYQLLVAGASIERKLTSDSRGGIRREDLMQAVALVSAEYEDEYQVVSILG